MTIPIEHAVNMLLARVAFDLLRSPKFKQQVVAHIQKKLDELKVPDYINALQVQASTLHRTVTRSSGTADGVVCMLAPAQLHQKQHCFARVLCLLYGIEPGAIAGHTLLPDLWIPWHGNWPKASAAANSVHAVGLQICLPAIAIYSKEVCMASVQTLTHSVRILTSQLHGCHVDAVSG